MTKKNSLSPLSIALVLAAELRSPSMAAVHDGKPVMTEEQKDDHLDTVAAIAARFADKFQEQDPHFKRASFLIDCGLADYSRVIIRDGVVQQII